LHHIDPAKKSPEYDNLIRRKLSAEQLDEVDKCALLCGNCHDILHSQNITIDVEVTLNAEGIEPIRHVLPCSIIYDYAKNEGTLFSDDLKFLDLYRVRIGSEPPTIMSGLQLRAILNQLLDRTRTDGELLITTLNGATAHRATRLSDTDVECEWNLDFPFITSQLSFKSATGDIMNMFLRPGNIITETGNTFIGKTYGRATMKVVTKYTKPSESKGVDSTEAT
jgi:hypothetical protein